MTAEVAVLNKSAVALAADSAVTISIGEKEEKTFDSADKLFELCGHNPIGVMVYNGLSFVEIPLQTIVKRFRASAKNYEYVKAASEDFLAYLNSYGASSPQQVRNDSVKSIISPALNGISKRFYESMNDLLFGDKTTKPEELPKMMAALLDDAIRFYYDIYSKQDDASFVGGKPAVTQIILDIINQAVAETFQGPQNYLCSKGEDGRNCAALAFQECPD